ncbi:MAG: hypothetical protein SGBAC_003958 [Bacillariaceae sp.]
MPILNTPPRDHRPPRPRRASLPVDDVFDNASGIFSTSGTISECTMASFLLESSGRTNSRASIKPNQFESPRHLMSPNTAALLQRKQEDARVAILSLNRFIFQAGNLYRGKRLNRHEEHILRESAHQVGLSLDIVDALLEHTLDSNAVVEYCMESEDSFAKKIRKDRRLSQLLQQDASEPEGNFNLKSSIWRILMHKIVQQTLRDHGMDIGDVMNKSSTTSQLYADLTHNDEYAMNSAERERYGRNYTEERKRLNLPEDEIKNARHRAIAQMEFQQSKGPLMDSLQNRDDVPLMIGAGPAVDYRDDEMSLLDARGSQHREIAHPTQRLQSSPLTPRSLNLQQQRNERLPSPGRTNHGDVDPANDQIDLNENDYDDIETENRPPHGSATNPQAALSAVKRALAMFEGPGKFDVHSSQRHPSSTPKKVKRGSSSKIAGRLALWEKGKQENAGFVYQQMERVKSSEHQAIQATSLFDVFSTPQKPKNVERQQPRAASTSKISKVKRAQIGAFENRGCEEKADENERVVRNEVKKLDPSLRRLFDSSARSPPSAQEKNISGSGDKRGRNSSAFERRAFSRMENIEAQLSHSADNINGLKHGWKNHSTPPTPKRNRRVSDPTSPSVSFSSNVRYHDHQNENQDQFGKRSPIITRGSPKKQVTFGESPRANSIRQQGSFSDPQKSAMDKILKKARTPSKPPTPSKQAQRSLKLREQLLANMSVTSKDEPHHVISHQPVPSDYVAIDFHHSIDESSDPIRQQGSFGDPQKTAIDRILKKAKTPPKPPTPSKQEQRSLKIRQQLLANMKMTSKDEHQLIISHQPVPSDNVSINSHHSMDESLDPTSVQDYGPRRETKRTPRPKRRNIREENFMEDERVRVQPPKHLRNEIVYFDTIPDVAKNMMEEDSLLEQAMNQDQEYEDITRNMMEENSLLEQAMNQDQEYKDTTRNTMEENSLLEQAMNHDQEYEDITRNMMEEDSFMEQAMNRDQEYHDITKNMMEEDSLVEQEMNADAHHSNIVVTETFSSSPGNNFGGNEKPEVPNQYSDSSVTEDDMFEEQAFVSDMASSRAASDQMPIDSMISSISSGELIHAPESQSTLTDENRSWVEFHQIFDSIHGAKSEVTQVESDLTSSRKSIENMFDTLHQVKQEAISMERRKPEREAKNTEKPVEAFHPVTPRAPKVYDNDFFEDIGLSGSKARFQVTHNDSESAEFDDGTRLHEHEQKLGFDSNTQVLNEPQTDPEEWAYFQNSHFHSDASYQEQLDMGREEDVEEHVSDITDPRDMPTPESDTTELLVQQLSYRNNGVNLATSTITASSDGSNLDFMNSYQSKVTATKDLGFSKVQEKPTKKVGLYAPPKPTEETNPTTLKTPQKSSPRYPRSPLFDKAMQKAKKHATKDNHENLEQDRPPGPNDEQRTEQESAPRYPRSPAFDKALQARKEKANDSEPRPSFDYHTLPPPPSLEEAFNSVDTETVHSETFHQAKTPRTSHGNNSKATTSRFTSIQMQRSSSSLSKFLRIDTSCSEEEDVGLNGVPVGGQQSLRQDAVNSWDKAYGGRGASPSAYRSFSETNEDVRSAAQANGVPQQIIDIILQQAAEHERELEEAATEADRISWEAVEKKTKNNPRAAKVESPIAFTAKPEALYSLPKQKKTKPVKLDVSLIPDDIPEGVPKEDVKLLERFIQLSTSQIEGKHLSAASESRVRSAAANVGLAEDVIDQMLEQARWKIEQKEADEDSLHLQEIDTNDNNNNSTHHQYYSDTSNLHVHFEDGGHSTRHKFGGASPVKPAYPESPGYTVPRDERWSNRRRRSEGYNRNACNDPCRILGNIKDNLLYWANCQGGGSFDEEEYSITGSDLQF